MELIKNLKMGTVISEAKKLIIDMGHEEAVKFFEHRIKRIGEPQEFSDICKISGFEIAIDFIREDSQK